MIYFTYDGSRLYVSTFGRTGNESDGTPAGAGAFF